MEEEQEIQLYSEEVRDILSHPPKAIFTWGNTILFGFISLLLALSWFIKYPDVLQGEAVLYSGNPPVFIAPQINENITKIIKENNDDVKQNEWLAILGNNASVSQIKKLDSILNFIKSINYDVEELILHDLPLLNLGEIQPQYNALVSTFRRFKHHEEDGNFSVQSSLQNLQLSEINNLFRIALRDLEISVKEHEIATAFYETNKALFDKGVIANRELETIELQKLQALRNYESRQSAVAQLRSQRSSLISQMKNMEHSEEESHLNSTIQLVQEMKSVEIAYEAWLKKYVLTSPIDGRLVYLENVFENKFVTMNQNLFSIVSEYTIEDFKCFIKIPIQNSGKVEIGQKINISLLGFPQSEYGILNGVLENISEIPNENNYLITASIINQESSFKKINFKHNMAGIASIITEDLNLASRLIYQLRDLFNQK